MASVNTANHIINYLVDGSKQILH